MKILRYFFSFNGRIGRLSFYLHHLAILGVVLGSILVIGFFRDTLNEGRPDAFIDYLVALVGPLVIIMTVSGLSAMVRRLHDLDKSGWSLLWNFVPFANIWLLIQLYFIPGTRGANRFDFDSLEPKEAEKEIQDERFINRERSQSKGRFDRN
jgi:Predicted membrane protein